MLRDLIAEQQPASTERWHTAPNGSEVQQQTLDRRAQDRRQARAQLFAYRAEECRELLTLWRECPYTADLQDVRCSNP